MGGALLAEPEEKENRQGGPCGLLCLLCCLLLSLFSVAAGSSSVGDAGSDPLHGPTFHGMPLGYFSRGSVVVLFAAAGGVRFYT